MGKTIRKSRNVKHRADVAERAEYLAKLHEREHAEHIRNAVSADGQRGWSLNPTTIQERI